MKTSVITSSMGRKVTLNRLFLNLATQTQLPDEIILIEAGGATWDNSEFPETLRANVRVLYAPGESLAASRARGQQNARGELLLFLDDDIIMPATYIAEASAYLRDNPAIMAVGGRYIDETVTGRANWSLMVGRLLGIYGNGARNRILPSGWLDYVRGKSTSEITSADWLFGCNSVIRASAFAHPDVHYTAEMAAWSFLEDGYFYSRVISAYGDCVRLLPGLEVVHAPIASSGSMSRVTLRMRILYRYIFWRDRLRDGSLLSRLRFDMGMLANLLLMLKQEKKTWVISECLKSYFFTLIHKNMTWEKANEFIFPPH